MFCECLDKRKLWYGETIMVHQNQNQQSLGERSGTLKIQIVFVQTSNLYLDSLNVGIKSCTKLKIIMLSMIEAT